MNEIDFSKVGLEMKKRRAALGVTQEKVAKDLECTVAFISNVENNRAKLNLRLLLYYSKLCNVSVDTLLSAGRESSTTQDAQELLDLELMRVFHQLSEADQKRVVRMIKAFGRE
ncbi:MAG: helix-turn-helix transcriptional regulator [Lachnospiraceae bacterium]|uniref:helix-turn-helix domain-containing protein n=1 Tax=Roseburia sp. 1XD42-69 TaxID=2320088 RepID=UPI001314535D|nr:helix-turn-helix transcriptional regulator [Roseburia sp. 1XD42-69]MCI8874858.1 helix-turn-helix transcriptional regulator [Lachnospiraceae bacterium]MCX4318507.1 helix-turn-helix transcriptional regulator [Lachnospiraceae bacterium]MDE6906355.1 helix-turn-helix domain-containing protein [Lachnospiraceae bacterium]MDE6980807.1 helix-turn-helix domain-containing protein [Lachnospiraceae bacterium]